MVAFGGEVGGCEEQEWGWAGGQGSMLVWWEKFLSTSLQGRQWLEKNSWFLGSEKKRDCLNSLRHHGSKGPVRAIRSLLS